MDADTRRTSNEELWGRPVDRPVVVPGRRLAEINPQARIRQAILIYLEEQGVGE